MTIDVSQEKLWKVLEENEVQRKLPRAIYVLYEGMACMTVSLSEAEMFDVYKGVRQDCTPYPVAVVFIDKLVREAKKDIVSG